MKYLFAAVLFSDYQDFYKIVAKVGSRKGVRYRFLQIHLYTFRG